MSIAQNGECGVSSRRFSGERDGRGDPETMIGKVETRCQCEYCNACHGDLKIYINNMVRLGGKGLTKDGKKREFSKMRKRVICHMFAVSQRENTKLP